MNILVTGGAGFIGCNVIRHIIERPEVQRLVNLDCLTYAGHLENVSAVSSHAKYHFEKEDIRDRSAVCAVARKHAITHVLHLAAETHVDRSIVQPGDFIETNIVGTFNLLEAFRELWEKPFAGKRFLHVSTDEVYGALGATGRFTESSPYRPNSPYAASKAASDMLVRAYHHTYGLPVSISHCSNNYGPYQFPEKLMPVVMQSVFEQKPIPVYGDGLHVRDWIYVRDHAEALWLMLTRGKSGETYNVGAHTEIANLQLVEMICDLCDELSAHSPGTSRRLIGFVEDRPGHDRRYAIDAGKLQRELGWRPQYTFEQGLRETVNWYWQQQPWVRAVKHSATARSG